MSTACAPLLTIAHDMATPRAPEVCMDFDALYREHCPMVTGLVRMMVGAADTDDVVQNVFLQVHRSLHRFRGESKLRTWIYRVTVNVCLQHRRSRARKKWLLLFRVEGAVEDVGGASPDGTLESRSALRSVEEALGRLTDPKRDAYILVEIQGLKPAEAAAILETPLNTVRSRVLAARREVHAHLRAQGVLP